MRQFFLLALLSAGLASSVVESGTIAYAQSATQPDTSVLGPDGSAHITRVVPVPLTISPQAQRKLAAPSDEQHLHRSMAQIRIDADAVQARAGIAFEVHHLGTIRSDTIGGVPVRIVTPFGLPGNLRARVLVDLHGGGGTQDTGSLTEALPLAVRARMQVISVLYRLAPEHPFPAAVDDAVAAYRALLSAHRPDEIGVFGTSSGAVLAAEFAVRLKMLHLPMPGGLG